MYKISFPCTPPCNVRDSAKGEAADGFKEIRYADTVKDLFYTTVLCFGIISIVVDVGNIVKI